MSCPCGRSPDSCRGWHALSDEQYRKELKAYKAEKNKNSFYNRTKRKVLALMGKGKMVDGEGYIPKYQELKVTEIEHYTGELFRFRTQKPDGFKFKAGEFTMIGLQGVYRAYSITSHPDADYLEFYSIKVENGPLTTKLRLISVGDTVEVSGNATGTLVTDYLNEGTDLWMFATGTGIAPFISLLRDPATRPLYDRLHVVWSVRTQDELKSYDAFLKAQDIDYIPIVTRDANWTGHSKRMTELMKERTIFDRARPGTDKAMLCGSLPFNVDVKKILEDRGWTEGSKRKQGDFTVEKAFVG